VALERANIRQCGLNGRHERTAIHLGRRRRGDDGDFKHPGRACQCDRVVQQNLAIARADAKRKAGLLIDQQ
jgi:hypothetical protein